MKNSFQNNTLYNALTCVGTGQKCNAEYRLVTRTITQEEAAELKMQHWKFDWSIPHQEGCEIYALRLKNDDEVQGMVALKHARDQFYTNLFYAEVAPSNTRSDRKYQGVVRCLFAVACKLSWDVGNEGYVLFRTTSSLWDEHVEMLNAKSISNDALYIDSYGAAALIDQYFKEINSIPVTEREETAIDQYDRHMGSWSPEWTLPYGVRTYQWREAILLSKKLGKILSTLDMKQFEVS